MGSGLIMILLGSGIFAFCTWAVFSDHFCDGIVTKHLLTFSAITSMLLILDPANGKAALGSVLFLVSGVAYWAMKHWDTIRQRLHIPAD